MKLVAFLCLLVLGGLTVCALLSLLAAYLGGGAEAVSARLRAWWDRRAPWRVETPTRPDGTTVIQLFKGVKPGRVVTELPPGMDPIDRKIDLEFFLREAEEEAATLNRRRR